MVFKYVIVCASALFIQSACSQYVSSGSTVTGNSIVDNNIYISGGGLANSGLVGFGSGSGFASGGSYSLGSNLVSSGSLGSNIVGSGSLGSNIVTSGSLGNLASSGLTGLNSGFNVVSSGPLTVTSISPIGPSGLAVASENNLEGVLTVSGQLPFLSAVAFKGGLPTAGSGVATCGCGNGDVAITSEGLPQGRGLRY